MDLPPAAAAFIATAGPRSFESFYAMHRTGLVRALGVALGDPGLAAEAVDEAMTRAVQRWDTVSGYGKPEGWVYRVAYNWATSRFRRLKRDRTYAPRLARPDSMFDPGFDPDVQDALDALSPDHRSVLVLRYFYDWDVQTTATALGVSPGTVKSRTSRALEQMAAALGEPVPTEPGSLAEEQS